MFRKPYHFLGSFYFAIIVIVLLALFVIVGTFLESATGSHLYASQFTYSSKFFLLILAATFINILFAALRRWPFKKKHIPFLITHLGLLMVISGVIIKNIYGVQGIMVLKEGSESHQIFLPQTHAVRIEKHVNGKEELPFRDYDLTSSFFQNKKLIKPISNRYDQEIPEFSVEVLSYTENSNETLNTWIQGNFCYICGLDPIFVYEEAKIEKHSVPISSKVKLYKNHPEVWDIYAFHTQNPYDISKRVYLENTDIIFRDNLYKELFRYPLKELLAKGIRLDGSSYSVGVSLEEEKLFLEDALSSKKFEIDLSSNKIFHLKTTGKHFIEISTSPKLLFLNDEQSGIQFYAIDKYGHIYSKTFSDKENRGIIIYERGFGGYFSSIEIPFPSYNYGMLDLLESNIYVLQKTLQQALKIKKKLSEPLELIFKTAQKSNLDVYETFFKILLDKGGLDDFYRQIDWHSISQDDLKGCYWSSYICENIETERNKGKPLDVVLNEMQLHFELIENRDEMSQIVDKVFQTAPYLSDVYQQTFSVDISKKMLFNYLNYYQIDLEHMIPRHLDQEIAEGYLRDFYESLQLEKKMTSIFPSLDFLSRKQKVEVIQKILEEKEVFHQFKQVVGKNSRKSIINQVKKQLPVKLFDRHENLVGVTFDNSPFVQLESPIFPKITSKDAISNLEENIPAMMLKVSDGQKSQMVSLRYDPFGKSKKWPIFDGKYRISFQPKFYELPVSIRLHEAREIKYPHSSQPLSFESDLFVTENGVKKPFKISMNHVYESNSGFRFYLSNIAEFPSSIKSIQLAVNYDPMKMFLTYPGSILVFIGIISLFWMKTKFRSKKQRFF